ncbi:MAG: T9SS type A sorting domain-containing protein, partial [Bacteroidia bacterium]|nr:T9SS type A sorting domain-containing protein [Bacteroidia bacterium]
YSRLEREWRVSKSNMSNDVGMDFVLSSCSGVINPMDLVLLVDDDGNFNNATKYGQGLGLVITYANNTISVSGISNAHIPDNSTRYITIASASPTTSIASHVKEEFIIFPNPATDQLIVRGSINMEGAMLVNNVLGENITKELNIHRLSSSELTIDISSLSEGVYFLKIGGVTKTFLKIK